MRCAYSNSEFPYCKILNTKKKEIAFSSFHHSFIYSIQQTQHDGRFYQLRIHCPEKYPATPPNVRFISKINMNCVDSRSGAVKSEKLPAMRNWNRNMGIEQVLQSIRMEMCSDQNRRLRQPAEGATF